MKKEQNFRLNMFLATAAFADANLSFTEKLPNFSENLVHLKKTNLQIQLIGELQKLDRSGITKGKNQLRSQLIVLAADHARKLTAFATFTNNPELSGEVNITETAFIHCSDCELKDYAQIIYDRAQSNLVSLAKYDITAETQVAFLALINDFNAKLGVPRVSTTTTVQATRQLKELFKTCTAAIKSMDQAVEIIRLSQPNFYVGYRSARKIIPTGVGNLSLKVKVVDKQTNEPIKGVAITMSLNNGAADSEPLLSVIGKVRKTAARGGANIKSLSSGTYQTIFRKAGYLEQMVKTSVSDGEMTNLKVALEKE